MKLLYLGGLDLHLRKLTIILAVWTSTQEYIHLLGGLRLQQRILHFLAVTF
jgi:hypothetical protein